MATSQQPTESCDVDQLPDPTKTKPSSFFSHPRNHQRLELSNKSDQRKSRIHTRTHLPVRGTNASIKRLPQIHPSNQPNTASSTQNLQAPAGKNGAGGSTLTSAEPPNHRQQPPDSPAYKIVGTQETKRRWLASPRPRLGPKRKPGEAGG